MHSLLAQPACHIVAEWVPSVLPTKDWLDRIAFAANLLLVGVGIWGIIVAIRSVKAAEKSASAAEQNAVAAKDGAQASLLNARTLVRAERPWLVVEATGFPNVTFRAVNKGRTPAQLLWYNNFPTISHPLIDEQIGQPHFGMFYEVEGSQIMNIPWVFPDCDMGVGEYPTDALKHGAPQLWEEIHTVKRWLYLYSAIKYKGPFSEDVYETRYCFRVSANGHVMAGDPGYNSHT